MKRVLHTDYGSGPSVSSQTHSTAVNEAFCKFFEDGLIYRENRLVNWCVRLNTTLSSLEVRRGFWTMVSACQTTLGADGGIPWFATHATG